MQPLYPLTVNNQEERDESCMMNGKQKLNKKSSSKKILHFNHRVHDYPRNLSFSSSSLATSYIKLNSMNQHENNQMKFFDYSALNIVHFTEKYLPRGAPLEQLIEEMLMVLQRKESQIQTIRVYRDELKFISFNNPYFSPIRLSVRSLKGKALTQTQIDEQKRQLNKQIEDMRVETQTMMEYSEFLKQEIQNNKMSGEIIDIEKEEAIMIQNLQLATEHLIKALTQSKKRYAAQIRQLQDEITDYRIQIKQKQDKLRDLKAKICTMYIKLHSRNSSRGKSHDRNMSFSIRKFNQSCHGMKELFIGNSSFKPYSREIIQKVAADEELIKIRFMITKDEELLFQCIYRNNEGLLHYSKSSPCAKNAPERENNVLPPYGQDFTRDKALSEDNTEKQSQPLSIVKQEQIYVKYLFSLKFFCRSKIVGVECRMKTNKGNKHLQIGVCDPYLQHELVTLVGKNLFCLGSYWHCRQMIGISIWYSDRLGAQTQRPEKSVKNMSQKKSLKPKYSKQTYEQYYT